MSFIINHWFLWLMMLGASALSFVWLFFVNKKLQMKWWQAVSVSVLSIFFGAFAAIVFNYLENGFNWSNPGTSVFGAIFIAPLVAYFGYLICEKQTRYLIMLDNITIVVAIFMVFTRINCIKSGCCYGILIGDTGYRYPTREMDMLVNALFIIIAAKNIFAEKNHSVYYFVYLLVYGISRFIIEWFRYSASNTILHHGHIWSICSILVGAILLYLIVLRQKRGEQHD